MWVYKEIRTLGDVAAYHARRTPERPALIYAGETTSYARFQQLANQVAHGLAAKGVARGDRVVYLGKNSDDYFIAMFGTVKQGACFCPLNWRLSKPEIANVLADCGARFAFVEPEFAALWREILAEKCLDLPVCIVDRARGADDPLRVWAAAHAAHEPDAVAMEAGALQLYTSGTTGDPKGVVITHDNLNHMRLCEHLEPALAWHAHDRFLVALPNFHLLAIGMALESLYNGMALLIERQFEPSAALRMIAAERPSITAFAPAMIQMLLDHPAAADTDFTSLRLTVYAGSPISLGLIRRAIARMPCAFMQLYGATESSGAITLLRPEEHEYDDERKLASCGKPLPLIALRIVDADGNEVPDGQPGELLVRSPALASGYWNKPELTAAVFAGGWYRSGDVAWRDAAGFYYIHDRVKDMIVSGGENIYSTEVESVLSTHPGVAAVAVIGVPDPRWGEAVKACVVTVASHAVTDRELLDFCRGRLAGYKIPKSVDFLPALPLTGSGKIAKKILRAPYWRDRQRAVA